jgi:hypothetical protein
MTVLAISRQGPAGPGFPIGALDRSCSWISLGPPAANGFVINYQKSYTQKVKTYMASVGSP